jgi:hypothetical protein
MKLFASPHQSRFSPGQMASGALINQQSATPDHQSGTSFCTNQYAFYCKGMFQIADGDG